MTQDALHPETIAVVAGRPERVGGAPLNEPITPASTFHHGEGAEFEYGRDGNPGWQAFEAAIGQLEGGHAVAFASGLAATSAILDLVPNTARVIGQKAPYFGVSLLMEERQAMGQLTHETRAELTVDALRDTIADADLLWIESPTNPMLDVVELPAVISLAKDAGAVVVVDNTFATPMGQNPIALGADLVLHSGTKMIGGHSDLMLGVVVAAAPELQRRLIERRHNAGATPGVLEAYLALRGLRTLPARYERAEATARELVSRLSSHPSIARVRYPGKGNMVSFETIGSGNDAERVCESLRLIVHATSLGGAETSMERRARYPSEKAVGTPDTLIRLSVGLEHVEDLWRDLDRALSAITGSTPG
jgi:cystathionine gamma-synthase